MPFALDNMSTAALRLMMNADLDCAVPNITVDANGRQDHVIRELENADMIFPAEVHDKYLIGELTDAGIELVETQHIHPLAA